MFNYSVKTLSPFHTCMKVGTGLYDMPHNEDEVVLLHFKAS